MFRVLFVCTANICRSPLAEAIFKKKIKDENAEDIFHVASSGTWAIDGKAASSLTRMVAREFGLSLDDHHSQAIRLELINSSDLILCMTARQKKDLTKILPHYDSKIFTLKEFGKSFEPGKNSIDDPISMSYNFYKRIFGEISAEITRIWPHVLELAHQKLKPV